MIHLLDGAFWNSKNVFIIIRSKVTAFNFRSIVRKQRAQLKPELGFKLKRTTIEVGEIRDVAIISNALCQRVFGPFGSNNGLPT